MGKDGTMSAVQMVMTMPNFESLTEEKLSKLSEVYETKAAFLALLEDPANVKVTVVVSAGISLDRRDALEDGRGLYGPAQHRRLAQRWATGDGQSVNEALQVATGYELHELTSCKEIMSCMSIVGPTSHPALYPALMKLYRLQREIEGAK